MSDELSFKVFDSLKGKNASQINSSDISESVINDILHRPNSYIKYDLDHCIRILGAVKGFSFTDKWIDDNKNIMGKGKHLNIKLRNMGVFGKNELENDLLDSALSNGISPMLFHRKICVLSRMGNLTEAIGFLTINYYMFMQEKNYRFIFNWMVKLQLWNLIQDAFSNVVISSLVDFSQYEKAYLEYFISGKHQVKSVYNPICFCVSLERDFNRMKCAKVYFDKYTQSFEHVVGVLGSSLPKGLFDNKELSPSVLGCGLSHWKALEKISNLPESHYLIIEDDAILLRPFSDELLLKAYDVILVNDLNGGERGLEVNEVIRDVVAGDCKGGAYGYLITPRGARLICKKLEEDGVFRNIDGQFFSYIEQGEVSAGITEWPIIGHYDAGFSSRFSIDSI